MVTLISLLVGSYAVITTKNLQLSIIDHNLDEIVASTKGAKGEQISSALLTVRRNNLDAVVDFVDGTSVSQLSLATFHIHPRPSKTLVHDALTTVESSTLGGGIRFRTVKLPGKTYLFIAVSSQQAQRSVHNLLLRLVLFTVIADLVAAVAAQLIIRRDTRKIEELIGLANDLADNKPNVVLPETSGQSDVDQLSSALRRMVGALNQSVVLERDTSLRMQQFLGDASHELRTPLTVIRGYTELLHSENVPSVEVQQRALGRVNDEVLRMEGLISDLLLLAELGEHSHTYDERVDLSTLVKDHLDDFQLLEPDRSVDANVEANLFVAGSSSHLGRLVQNILSNIRRHTATSDPVSVQLRQRGDVVELNIEDGGSGLPASAYEHGPQGFMRFDQGRSRESGGSGLGMSIMVAIVQDLNGTLDFRPSQLGGLLVAVSIPRYGATPLES
jgi:signal transduction histidine kinase